MVDLKKEKEEYEDKVRVIKRKVSAFVKKRKETFSIAEKNTRATLIALEVKSDRPRDLVYKIRKSLAGMQDTLCEHDKKVEDEKLRKEIEKELNTKERRKKGRKKKD
jgi:hypothetical protein